MPAIALARALIGARLASRIGPGVTAVRIVEAEAYHAEGDPAAHTARGLKAALAAFRRGPGALYVHPMRGRCGLDIIAADGSVLIRAGEPQDGLATMAARRGTEDPRRLARGPACLAEALGITCALNGLTLGDPACPLTLDWPGGPATIALSPRIGISTAAQRLLRFYEPGNPHVSAAPRRAQPG